MKYAINHQKRLSAFTLYEVLLAMAITTVVLGLFFRGLADVRQQFNLYQERSALLAEFDRGTTLLRHDIDRADQLRYTDNQLQLLFSAQTGINYVFSEEGLIRTLDVPTSPIDTFPLSTIELQVFFEGVAVVTSEAVPPLVDEVDWTFYVVDAPRKLHFRKEYATFDLLSRSTHGY